MPDRRAKGSTTPERRRARSGLGVKGQQASKSGNGRGDDHGCTLHHSGLPISRNVGGGLAIAWLERKGLDMDLCDRNSISSKRIEDVGGEGIWPADVDVSSGDIRNELLDRSRVKAHRR